MAGVLPPWHDGCHGSRVWRGKPPVEQKRPPFGDGPHGSQQGVTPCTPHRARRARGCSWDMQLGREATAARRQASRLAGLVRLPAGWPIQTAIRRQASWLATKASVDLKSRWPFARQKYPSYQKTSQPARVKPAPRQLRGKENQPIYPRRKTFRPQRSIPTCKGGACQPPTAGEQSGDRQRREKALPFLKEEKSEHERART